MRTRDGLKEERSMAVLPQTTKLPADMADNLQIGLAISRADIPKSQLNGSCSRVGVGSLVEAIAVLLSPFPCYAGGHPVGPLLS